MADSVDERVAKCASIEANMQKLWAVVQQPMLCVLCNCTDKPFWIKDWQWATGDYKCKKCNQKPTLLPRDQAIGFGMFECSACGAFWTSFYPECAIGITKDTCARRTSSGSICGTVVPVAFVGPAAKRNAYKSYRRALFALTRIRGEIDDKKSVSSATTPTYCAAAAAPPPAKPKISTAAVAKPKIFAAVTPAKKPVDPPKKPVDEPKKQRYPVLCLNSSCCRVYEYEIATPPECAACKGTRLRTIYYEQVAPPTPAPTPAPSPPPAVVTVTKRPLHRIVHGKRVFMIACTASDCRKEGAYASPTTSFCKYCQQNTLAAV